MIKYTLIFPVQLLLILVDTSADCNAFVAGGRDAPQGAFPYQVSVRKNGNHFCGGSIIGSKIILTSAHCVYGKNPKDITVVTGTNRLDRGGKTYHVSALIHHPEFSHTPGSPHDIGLIKLSRPVKYSSRVAPVEISSSHVGIGETAVLSGWGKRSFTSKGLVNALQELFVKTISKAKCRQLLHRPIRDGQVCTLPHFGKGACKGDYGGPLVIYGIQIGIVSWGIKCANNYPDVYTRVSHYTNWIKHHLK